jgi:rhodanese-related sulfurtransferase
VAHEIHPEELHARRERGERIVVLDVRDAEDFAAGHVAGALHLPLTVLQADPHSVPLDRPIVTVCGKGGGRSAAAVAVLAEAGAPTVAWLTGGTNGWRDAGLPIEKE